MFSEINKLNISTISDAFHIDINTCPKCGAVKGTFKVDKSRYKCFRCGVNGSGLNLLVDVGAAKDLRDSAHKISKALGIQSSFREMRRESSRRQAMLSSIWKLLSEEMQKALRFSVSEGSISQQAINYYQSRGWSSDYIAQGEVGLCPTEGYLTSRGYSHSELELCGLISPMGWEYLSNRIVFPIKRDGVVHHLQGRAFDDSSVRWISTSGQPPISTYLYGIDKLKKGGPVFLCEGISDTFSIHQIGLNAVGTFGINFSPKLLTQYIGYSSMMHAVFDNDKYPIGSEQEGIYKSWSVVLETLIQYSSETGTPVSCLVDDSNQLDINDLLVKISYNSEKFLDIIERKTTLLPYLALDAYQADESKHHLIWRSLVASYDTEVVNDVLDKLAASPQQIAKAFTYTRQLDY